MLTENVHESCNVLDTGSLDVKMCKSPTLHAPEVTNLAASSTVVSSNTDVLNLSNPLVTSSCSKPPRHPTNVPVFVSHAPTGLTSPVALRSMSNGFGKDKNKTYPSFVDSNREPSDNKAFNPEKHHHITKKHIGNLNRRQSSPMYFSSIAERTRSQSSKCDYGTLVTTKVTKQAERQLSKLEIKMNTFKAYQTNSPSKKITKPQNEDGLQHHETSKKQNVILGNRVKKENGKRKRPRKQPRSDLKRKRYNAGNPNKPVNFEYTITNELFDQQIPQLQVDGTLSSSRNYDEIQQTTEVENKENDESLSKSEGELDKSEVDLDKSEGELDSSNGNNIEEELVQCKDIRVFNEMISETKECDEEKHEDKSEGKQKEDKRESKLNKIKEDQSEGENTEEKCEAKLDRGKEDGKNKCESQLSTEKGRSEVETKEEKLVDGNKEVFREDCNESENEEEKLEDKNGVELEDRDEVQNIKERLECESKVEIEDETNGKLTEDRSTLENKEEKLEDKNGGNLEEGESEVEDMEEKLKDKNKEELEEDRSEVANKEGKLENENGRELEEDRRSIVEDTEEKFKEGMNGRDKKKNNEEESKNKEKEIKTKYQEQKSDGELDSEEDESINRVPKTSVSTSPGHWTRKDLFTKVRISLLFICINYCCVHLQNKPNTESSMSATLCVEDTLDPPCNLLKGILGIKCILSAWDVV